MQRAIPVKVCLTFTLSSSSPSSLLMPLKNELRNSPFVNQCVTKCEFKLWTTRAPLARRFICDLRFPGLRRAHRSDRVFA